MEVLVLPVTLLVRRGARIVVSLLNALAKHDLKRA